MNRSLARSLGHACWLLLAAVSACSTTPPPQPPARPAVAKTAKPTAPLAADGAAPTLRTGAAKVADLGEVAGEVVGRFEDDGIETIEIAFRSPHSESGPWQGMGESLILPESPTSPLSFVDQSPPSGGGLVRLWLRRPKGATGPIRATVVNVSPMDDSGSRWVVTAAPSTKAGDPKQRAAFAASLEAYFGRHSSTLFGADAVMRVRRAYAPKKAAAATPRPGRAVAQPVTGDLAELMRATTGIGALRAALGNDRSLVTGAPVAPSIPIASLEGPKLDTHPWAQMRSLLGTKPKAEALADLAPADGWFVRAASLGALFRLLDEADAWGTSAARLAEDVAFDADLSTRYETQLGLRRSELSRRFGDRVVGEVAVVGSDPYVREGTDVTLLFRLKSPPLFDGALADALADRANGHGTVQTSKVIFDGVDITIDTTADGAVRRHRATIGDVAIVSNSLAATKRVIAVAKKRAPALSGEIDIQYALARDAAEPADVLGLVGERWVRAIVGPAHKIAQARRQTAHAELLAPGAAAVLHGWLRGAQPVSTDALVTSRLLDRSELSHSTGGAITFAPGQAPRSAWGSPAFMEPLIDRPAVDKVTPGERDGYAAFRQSYEAGWAGEPFDPIALRVALPEAGPLSAHVRVLPIPRDRDMDELMRVVGDKRVTVQPTSSGATMVLGLSPDDRWRRELGLDVGRMIGGDRRALDWIGEWVAVGVADRNGLLVALRSPLAPELPDPDAASHRADELAIATNLPLWIGVEVRSPATLGILLTVVRKMADDVIPGMVRWGEVGKEGAVPIVAVRVASDALGGRTEQQDAQQDAEVSVFYAIAAATKSANAAVYASLKEDILRGLVRDHASGRGPRAPAAGVSDPKSAQALIDVATERGGPITTFLQWVAEDAARQQQKQTSAFAEWFLRAGAPGSEAALARAYLGAAPTTPSGKAYAWGPGGVTDPDRGSAAAPVWPAIPVAGTPMSAIVDAIARARIATSFDREPMSTEANPIRSFTARITIDKR